MTKPRPLGNNALEAANTSVEAAFLAIMELRPISEGKALTAVQIQMAVTRAIAHVQEIRVQLASIGAKVRP
jgi:hypothetical protein